MGRNDEALIQVETVKYLQSESIFFFSVPNEAAAGNKVRQMQLISMGLRSGLSDLILWLPLPGDKILHFYLEMKKPGGKQSDSQKRFQARCERNDILYGIAFSVQDVIDLVEDHKRKYWDH